MAQTVELRKCKQEDIAKLRALALQSYEEHYMYLWTEEKYARWYMDISFSEQSLLKQMNETGSTFYFVLSKGVSVGFIKINTNKAPTGVRDNKSLEPERIYLLEETTNKGVGKKAVQILIEMAKNEGVKIIWLKSMESSKAVQFYEKIGFQKIRTDMIPFEGFKDEYRNIYLMQLGL